MRLVLCWSPHMTGSSCQRWNFGILTSLITYTTSLTCKSGLEVFIFLFRRPLAHTTSLTWKSEPEVVPFSRFGGTTHTMVSTTPHLFRQRHTSFDDATLVSFSRSDSATPVPPPSHAKASRRWFHYHVSTTPHRNHLHRMQKRAGGGSVFVF